MASSSCRIIIVLRIINLRISISVFIQHILEVSLELPTLPEGPQRRGESEPPLLERASWGGLACI